jgi:WD40 repeat protein
MFLICICPLRLNSWQNVSGFAALSYDRGSLLIWNLKTGIDNWALSPFRLTKTYKHSIRALVSFQITTALRGKWVVSGSDDGAVRFFDPKSGQMIHCLLHGDREFSFLLFLSFVSLLILMPDA